MRSTLRKYPGLGESDRIINCGIQVLRDAGFGDWSTLVYSVLLCQTCAFVATEDDRDKMDDVRKEVGGSYASALSASDPGIAALAKNGQTPDRRRKPEEKFFLIISSQSFSMLFSADWKRFF